MKMRLCRKVEKKKERKVYIPLLFSLPMPEQTTTIRQQTPPVLPNQGSDDILGFKKDVFIAIVKYSAIAGGVAGAITFLGGKLTALLSWWGIFAVATGGVFGVSSFYTFFHDVLQRAISGIIIVLVVVKFYDKFPFNKFNTLFMKFFGITLIIDIIFSVLIGGLVLIFAGPLSFIILVATMIIADYVFAKMVTGKVGPLVGLQ